MGVYSERLRFSTKGNCHIIDITQEISKILSQSSMTNGTLTVFVPGATGAVTIMEYEPGLLQDMVEMFDRLISSKQNYHHNAAWQDENGHSHLRASLIGPSLSIPFIKSKLTLGTWQQVIFLDFDCRPREREIIIQIVGEQ